MTSNIARYGLVSAALAAAAVPLFAGSGGAASNPLILSHISCDAVGATTGQVHCVRAAHIDLDGRLDLLAHVGGEVIYLTGPDAKNFSSSLGVTGVSALTTLPLDGTWIEGAVIADAVGLSIVRRDLEDDVNVVWKSSSIGSAAWANARSVQAADVDADGDLDLVGLDHDGDALLVLNASSVNSAGVQQWTEDAPVALAVSLTSIDVVNVGTQVGVAGIAGSSNDDLRIVALDGTPIATIPLANSADDVAILRSDAGGDDEFAVLMGNSVTVVHADGTFEPALSMSALSPTGIGAGDMNGDGLDDLIVNSTVADAGYAYFRAPESQPVAFSLTNSAEFNWDRPDADMSAQLCAPIAADFDGDGDDDLFTIIDDERSGALYRSSTVDQIPLLTEIEDVMWFLSTQSSAALVTLRVAALEDGSIPDAFEIRLDSQPFDTKGDPPQEAVVAVLADNTQPVAGETANFWIYFERDLGTISTLSVRGVSFDPVTEKIDTLGVESHELYLRTFDDPTRGTINGIDPIIREPSIDPSKLPPLPPKPIDPFAKPD